MLEFLRQTLAQVKALWNRLGWVQRTILVGAPALLLLLLLSLALRPLWRETYEVLYSDLDAKDAGKVVEKLKTSGVPYKLSEGGSSILVPGERVHDSRLTLAAEGIPKFGSIGLEIFDEHKFGITEKQQQINFQRALQGELERTIEAMEGVRRARVALVMPEPRLYLEDQHSATAAIVVALKPDARFSVEQAKTVIQLAAGSVEGLKPANVSVSDTLGRSYSDLLEGTWEDDASKPALARHAGQVEEQLRLKREYEKELEKKVVGMLTKVLGANRATAIVNVDFDFDAQSSESETFNPVVGDTAGIVRSRTDERETYVQDGALVPGLPGGVPGVETNVPLYQEGDGAQAQYSRNKLTENMEISRRIDRSERAPGRVRRITCSVVVNNVQPQQQAALESVVRRAIGADIYRGDEVSVENIPFDTTLEQEEKRDMEQAASHQFFAMLMKGGLILGVALFLLLFLRSLLRPRVVREIGGPLEAVPPPFEAEPPLDLRLEPEPEPEVEPEPEPEPEVEPEPIITEETTAEELDAIKRRKEMEHRRRIREEVERLAVSKPENVANLIKRWLTEE